MLHDHHTLSASFITRHLLAQHEHLLSTSPYFPFLNSQQRCSHLFARLWLQRGRHCRLSPSVAKQDGCAKAKFVIRIVINVCPLIYFKFSPPFLVSILSLVFPSYATRMMDVRSARKADAERPRKYLRILERHRFFTCQCCRVFGCKSMKTCFANSVKDTDSSTSPSP